MKYSIASILLKTGAVHLAKDEQSYFTWTSGIKSPIYCNNRKLISHPKERKVIIEKFCKIIKEQFANVDYIAGTATAGIPWASWIAESLDLPLLYIRSSAKEHGLKSAIEGDFEINKNVLIIEDLISTGKSSLNAAMHVKNDNLNPLCVLSIFSYDIPQTFKTFENAKLQFIPLCHLDDLLSVALKDKFITSAQGLNLKNFISNL